MSPRSIALSLLVAGCAHAPAARPAPSGPTLELQLDDGHASERPLTPNQTFEVLMRFDPGLPQWTPRRLRFLLAQPGHLFFTLYAEGADGHPGRALAGFDRVYDASLVSTGRDGRWVIEELELAPQRGPLWIGFHSPGGDVRLWASSNSAAVYMRDPDPAAPFQSTRIPRTPMLRVEVAPAAPSS